MESISPQRKWPLEQYQRRTGRHRDCQSHLRKSEKISVKFKTLDQSYQDLVNCGGIGIFNFCARGKDYPPSRVEGIKVAICNNLASVKCLTQCTEDDHLNLVFEEDAGAGSGSISESMTKIPGGFRKNVRALSV